MSPGSEDRNQNHTGAKEERLFIIPHKNIPATVFSVFQ